jgi:hypothetical protein
MAVKEQIWKVPTEYQIDISGEHESKITVDIKLYRMATIQTPSPQQAANHYTEQRGADWTDRTTTGIGPVDKNGSSRQ